MKTRKTIGTEVAKAPGVPMERRMIWGDCPACAYKHLTAAYAALTAVPAGPCHADTADIMAARALILMREARTGYPGNAALACGCLANAELMTESRLTADRYRAIRLAVADGSVGDDELDTIGYTAASLAAAHLTEALRELPELGDRVQWSQWLTFGGFDCPNPGELLETLRRKLLWLSETYEIGKLEATKQCQPALKTLGPTP